MDQNFSNCFLESSSGHPSDKCHWTLVKNGKEDFIQDYCNRGQNYCNRGWKLNSALPKQKVGGFLNARVSWLKSIRGC